MSNANLFSFHSLSSQPDAKYTGVVSISGETTSFSYQNLSTPSHQPPPITVSEPNPIRGANSLIDPTAILAPPNSSNKSYFSASVGAQLIALLNLVAYEQSEASYKMEKAQVSLIFQTFAVSQQNVRLMAAQAQEDVEKYVAQIQGGLLQMSMALAMVGLSIVTQIASKIHQKATEDRKLYQAITSSAATTPASVMPAAAPVAAAPVAAAPVAAAPVAAAPVAAAPVAAAPVAAAPVAAAPVAAAPVDASNAAKPSNAQDADKEGDHSDSGDASPTSISMRSRSTTDGNSLDNDAISRSGDGAARSATADPTVVAKLGADNVRPQASPSNPMAESSTEAIQAKRRANEPTVRAQDPVTAALAGSPAAANNIQPPVTPPPQTIQTNAAAINVPDVPATQQVTSTSTGSALNSGTPSSVASHPVNSSPAIDNAGAPLPAAPGAGAPVAAAQNPAGAAAGGAAAAPTPNQSSAATAAAPTSAKNDNLTPKRWYEQIAEATAGTGGQIGIELSKSINVIMTQAGIINYLDKIADIQKAQASAQEYEKMLETATQLYQTAVSDITREVQTTLDNIKQIAEQTQKMTSIATK